MSDLLNDIPDTIKQNWLYVAFTGALTLVTTWWARKDKKDDGKVIFENSLLAQIAVLNKTVDELRTSLLEKDKQLSRLSFKISKIAYAHDEAALYFNMLLENVDPEIIDTLLPKQRRKKIELINGTHNDST